MGTLGSTRRCSAKCMLISSHGLTTQVQFYTAGGASPIASLLTEAGEPFPTGLRMLYDESMRDLSVTELWKLQIQRSEVAKQYLDAWNNTAKVTASGRPIDAIIRFAVPRFCLILVLLHHIQRSCMMSSRLALRIRHYGIC